MNIIKKVEIYGDSILKGVMLDENTGRYYFGTKENIKKISEDFDLDIVNNAKFGCTITKGYTSLKKKLDNGLDCDAVILEYGGNDCDYNWEEISKNPTEEFLPKTEIKEFKDTYIQMITDLKVRDITPVLISLPPISAEKYINFVCRNGISKDNLLLWLGDIQRVYRYQELYSSVIEELAHEQNVPFIDVRKAFLEKKNLNELLCEDGIHPNNMGHKIITDTVTKFMQNCKDFVIGKTNERPVLY